MIRQFTIEDYDEVYQLWNRVPGIGIRSLDDSREGISKFIRRNPATNFIIMENNTVIGSLLSGHDGRRGYLYHVCVEEAYRGRSYGRQLVEQAAKALRSEGINKLVLVCFRDNDIGNGFWKKTGWELRSDLNYYTLMINE